METLWGVLFALVIMLGLKKVAEFLFKHEPAEDGTTCGWSGCPSCTERDAYAEEGSGAIQTLYSLWRDNQGDRVLRRAMVDARGSGRIVPNDDDGNSLAILSSHTS